MSRRTPDGLSRELRRDQDARSDDAGQRMPDRVLLARIVPLLAERLTTEHEARPTEPRGLAWRGTSAGRRSTDARRVLAALLRVRGPG